MFQVDLLYLTVGSLPKNFQIFRKTVMQKSWSYTKDSGDFMEKIKKKYLKDLLRTMLIKLKDFLEGNIQISGE